MWAQARLIRDIVQCIARRIAGTVGSFQYQSGSTALLMSSRSQQEASTAAISHIMNLPGSSASICMAHEFSCPRTHTCPRTHIPTGQDISLLTGFKIFSKTRGAKSSATLQEL